MMSCFQQINALAYRFHIFSKSAINSIFRRLRVKCCRVSKSWTWTWTRRTFMEVPSVSDILSELLVHELWRIWQTSSSGLTRAIFMLELLVLEEDKVSLWSWNVSSSVDSRNYVTKGVFLSSMPLYFLHSCRRF